MGTNQRMGCWGPAKVEDLDFLWHQFARLCDYFCSSIVGVGRTVGRCWIVFCWWVWKAEVEPVAEQTLHVGRGDSEELGRHMWPSRPLPEKAIKFVFVIISTLRQNVPCCPVTKQMGLFFQAVPPWGKRGIMRMEFGFWWTRFRPVRWP